MRPGIGWRRSSARIAASSDGAANSTVSSMIGFQQRCGVRLVSQWKVLPLQHLGSKQQIDGEEVTPHEPVLAVHFEIEAAAKNRRDSVKPLACLDAALLDLLRRHAARRERHHSVSVIRIEPPSVIQKAPFALQAIVERSAGEWREVVEGYDVELVAFGECQRFFERVAIVFVVAEDEGDVEADLMALEVRQRLLIATLHHVE